MLLTSLQRPVIAIGHPLQWIAVYEEGLRYWRRHEVTILVGDVRHRHGDALLVDARIQLVDIDQQLVVASHEAEIQVFQFYIGLYGSTYLLVHTCHDVADRIDEDSVMLISEVAFIVKLLHLAQHIGLQRQISGRLQLLTLKVDIGEKTLLRTAR